MGWSRATCDGCGKGEMVGGRRIGASYLAVGVGGEIMGGGGCIFIPVDGEKSVQKFLFLKLKA